MNYLFLIPIGILFIYVFFNLLKINTEKQESFTDIDDIKKKIKDSISSLRKEIKNFDKGIDGMVDKIQDLGGNIEDFLKGKDDFSKDLDEKILKIIKKVFKEIFKKVSDPKTLGKMLYELFKLLWKLIVKLFNHLYKKYSDFRKIIYIVGFFMILPLMSIISMKVSFLEIFLPKILMMPLIGGILIFIYFFFMDILKFIFNYIIKKITSIEWEDVFEDIAKELGSVFSNFFKSLVNI